MSESKKTAKIIPFPTKEEREQEKRLVAVEAALQKILKKAKRLEW